MDARHLSPLLVPLLVLFIMYRRAGRVRRVRVNRLWISPAIIIAACATTIYQSGLPPFLWFGGYLVAAAAGTTLGYYRSRHTHLSVNPENGEVQAKQTLLATAIIMGLFVVKLGIQTLFPQAGGGGSQFTPEAMEAVQTAQQASHGAINYGVDALLVFSTLMLVTGAAETWLRATRLLAAHRGEIGDISI